MKTEDCQKTTIEEHLNKCDECVVLDDIEIVSSGNSKRELRISLNFNIHNKSFAIGDISIGVSSADLKLKLNNCDIPLSNRNHTAHMEKEINIKREIKKFSGNKSSKLSSSNFSSKASGFLTGAIGANLGMEKTNENEGSNETRDIYDIREKLISTYGGKSNPAWRFETFNHDCIIGSYSNELLGIAKINKFPIKIVAEVNVYPSNIIVTPKGKFLKNKSTINKNILLSAILWKFYLKDLFYPYISRMVIQHG